MAVYDYRAVDRAGRRLKGTLEGESARAVRGHLRGQGLFPVDIRPAGAEFKLGLRGFSLARVRPKELAGAVRQLSILIGAGLPVVDALSAVAEQAGRTRLGRILSQVKERVVSGGGLAESLNQFPAVFPDLAVNMIRAGEAAGALEVVLERLADLLENRVRLADKVRAALAYPLFMLLVGGGVLSFLFVYVVPTVTEIFTQTGQALPLPTRILMSLVHGAAGYGWLAAPVVGAAVLIWLRLRRTRRGRSAIDRFKLKIPFIGPVIKKLVLVRFTRTMATLLASGVSVVDALGITAKVTGNQVYQTSIEAAEEKIEQGASLAGELSRSPLFPPLISHLTAAGERAASLDKVFARLAQGLEEEVESSLSGLLSLLEPVLILVMGVVVGFIMVSILLPIFDMTSLIR